MSRRRESASEIGARVESTRLIERLIAPRTIRHRLTQILLVSLALVLALLGVTIAGQFADHSAANGTQKAVSLALTVQDAAHELQRERGLTNGMLGGENRYAATMGPQRLATDKALETLTNAVADDSTPGAPTVRAALDRLGALITTRQNVDASRADRAATFQWYTSGIAALNEAEPGLDQAYDPDLRRGLRALGALGAAKEATAQERGFLNGVFAAGRFGAGEYVRFTEIRAARQVGLAAFRHDATATRRAQLDDGLKTEAATRAADSETLAVASAQGPIAERVDPVEWWEQMTSVVDQMRDVQRAAGEDLRQRAVELRDDATVALIVSLVLAVLAVGLEVALVVRCLRSIVRPLATLATEAHDIAARRLPNSVAAWQSPDANAPAPPEPVRTPARAGEEIASVARALDRVQSTAFELASEQALVRRNTTESLANLGRRNQNLVRRQLGFISEFERDELDPAALAKLFELDHLATRMRRNAESLLVLVGEQSPRRWTEPLAITDVIRAGLSEVEDYRRVALRRVENVLVTGAVVSELAHLLAELIENALAFSPPDVDVEIHGGSVGTRYMLAVVDHGVGMSAEQLARANARLRGEEDFIVAPTRFLGHYVVGRLAERLGVEVELIAAPVSGIVARVLLPAEILADAAAVAPAVAPPETPAARTGEIRWPVAEADVPVTNGTATAVLRRPHRVEAPEPSQTTRNGLVKRNPGNRTGVVRPSPPRPAPTAVAGRSPEEVRAMLTRFRSAHQRGADEKEESL
ncbi:sensor histidine kinase [Lentzea kentuckyensis]|uniref:sensor histidine kinase n=1 Tax=Lentzea kentuckyensis TaxID=360086 RepID=UPI001FEBB747|nr:nitrate- and nitrite sensing domain-containing protein [Lentzea kentuckyensis]